MVGNFHALIGKHVHTRDPDIRAGGSAGPGSVGLHAAFVDDDADAYRAEHIPTRAHRQSGHSWLADDPDGGLAHFFDVNPVAHVVDL